MRSDEAWQAGHHAAASALVVSGLGPIVATLIVAVKKPDPDTQATILRVGKARLLALLGVATFQAHRAGRPRSSEVCLSPVQCQTFGENASYLVLPPDGEQVDDLGPA